MKFHLTPSSSNVKTGKIPVTTSAGQTCPETCPFNHRNAGGCYAEQGKLALHWRKVTQGERGENFDAFLTSLSATLAKKPARQLWRHNQAGDLPGEGNAIDAAQSFALANLNARHGARGWTYTHKPVLESEDAANALANRETVREMNDQGFVVNLSGNNLAHADKLKALGIAPVVVVLPAGHEGRAFVTPAGNKGVVCPAQLSDKVTCATCGLCAVGNAARPMVGFLAHGPGAKKAEKTARA
jgi:hypothetical protein